MNSTHNALPNGSVDKFHMPAQKFNVIIALNSTLAIALTSKSACHPHSIITVLLWF